jgi:hypothetical protein
MAAVPSEFLPPDPYAEAPPAPQPASRPLFLPPTATLPAPREGQNNRAVAALIVGSASLGLLFFSAGLLFFVTIPGSIAAWILGHRAKRLDTGQDQANVAVIIAIAGLVLGVIAAAVWILLIALGEYSPTTEVDNNSDGGLRFDVIRLALPGS